MRSLEAQDANAARQTTPCPRRCLPGTSLDDAKQDRCMYPNAASVRASCTDAPGMPNASVDRPDPSRTMGA